MTTPKDIGPPIDYSDDDLDTLSQITPADVKASEALWRRDAPPGLRELLAAPEEPDA